MSVPTDWLTDVDTDALLAEQRPHPTIPQTEIDALNRALRHTAAAVRVNLEAARRLRSSGRAFEHVYQVWRNRQARLIWLRVQLNDIVIRHADADPAHLWAVLDSVRDTLHERIRQTEVARDAVG